MWRHREDTRRGDSAAFSDTADAEAEEVLRARARDPAVWAAWHDRHYAFVYRYALSRLRNQHDAEDIASEVFLQAIKGIDRYRYRGRPVLAWLYGITRNLVSHRYRASRRTTIFSDLGAPAEQLLSYSDGDEGIDRIVLYTALDRLKPEHREVLVLRFLLGLPTKRVAAILGKGEAATYSLQVRALGSMRRAMMNEDLEKDFAGANDLPSLPA